MRIISGKYKNRRLFSPADQSIRPLMDRVKEWIFNVIQFDVQGSRVLDLFAGSGSFAFEACSHSASHVTLVDHSAIARKTIEKNINHLKLSEPHTVIQTDVSNFIKKKGQNYDIVFCDPPYDMENIAELFERIVENEIVAENGMLIVEHHSKVKMPEELSTFSLLRDKKFGKTIISIFGKK